MCSGKEPTSDCALLARNPVRGSLSDSGNSSDGISEERVLVGGMVERVLDFLIKSQQIRLMTLTNCVPACMLSCSNSGKKKGVI